MKKQEKLQLLRKFKEKPLIDNVIIPLLEKMEFKNITVTHGSLEKGKDLLFYKENEFEEREYTGVQVKAVDIHGRAGEKGNATEILTQAQQAFTHEFQDIYDNKTKNIDRYIVMTSGKISEAAKESIGGQLKAVGCYKSIQFFDDNKLVDLVDKWMPDFFWEEYNYFNRYFMEMKKDFETIKDISAIGQKEPISLEDIYVSLKLSETVHEGDLSIERVEIEDKIFDENLMEKRKIREVKRERLIDPGTAMKQFHKLVIVGAPGAGKTTLLKHLALKYCRENIEKQERTIVPIPITLREFFQSGKGLRDYIDVVFNKYMFPEASKLVEKDLKTGKCILLLDGFDELAARENQERVTKEVHAFVKQYQGCKVVVTSRVAEYYDDLANFTRLEVMEFDDSQIKRFIENWFGESQQKKAQSMLKAVMENENIKTLARNPLMVAIISIIYEEDRELPQRRADLYKRAVDVLLSRWDLRKKLKNRFKVEQKEFILRKLAFRCHCRNLRVMKETEILEEISKYSSRLGLKKDQTKPLLEEIWQRSYLLKQIAMGTYDFLHLSFQEYFTALELKEQEDGIGTIISHLDEPWWEEPILLYAGICKDAGPLIQRIQKEVPEDVFYSNLMLFGKCIADAEFTEPKLKDEIAHNLWQIYETEGFALLLKEMAMEVLRKVNPPCIIGLLLKQLKNNEPGVRWVAAYALGIIGNEESFKSLIQLLIKDKSSYVRWRVANALGEIGNIETLPALIKAFTTDKESYVKKCSAYALGKIGNKKAVSLLFNTLTDSSMDADVQAATIEALIKIGKVNGLPTLIKTLLSDDKSYAREFAALILGQIKDIKALPALIKTLANDKDIKVKWSAASALGAIGDIEAIPTLANILKTSKNSSVRSHAAEALGEISSANALSALIQTLKSDKDFYVRSACAYALGKIGNVDAVPALIESLNSEEETFVKENVLKALGTIRSIVAIPTLVNALTSSKERNVREISAYALREIGDLNTVPVLIKSLNTDKDKYVRCAATNALGAIGSKEAISSLLKAITSDRESIVRRTAAEVFQITKRPEVIPKLIEVFEKDNDLNVRIETVGAIGAINSAESINYLIEVLEMNEKIDVRLSAANALGEIGNNMAIQPLKKALKDEEESITFGVRLKDAAFEALYKISRRLGVRIFPDDRVQKTDDRRRMTDDR